MGPIDVDNVPVVGSILDDSHKAVLYYAVDIGLLSEKDLKSWWPNVFTDKAEIQSLCKPTGLEAVVYGPDGGLYYALANGKTQLTGGGCFEDVRGAPMRDQLREYVETERDAQTLTHDDPVLHALDTLSFSDPTMPRPAIIQSHAQWSKARHTKPRQEFADSQPVVFGGRTRPPAPRPSQGSRVQDTPFTQSLVPITDSNREGFMDVIDHMRWSIEALQGRYNRLTELQRAFPQLCVTFTDQDKVLLPHLTAQTSTKKGVILETDQHTEMQTALLADYANAHTQRQPGRRRPWALVDPGLLEVVREAEQESE
ncbi:hypothetical protein CLAFUW4_12276 [Fulvia fulva]|uniref:Uncharacterized protein n=1 Tax=Passalora fulva TaxID=5499 RepID=A0A9Q8PEM1_PASFU|nr:uncharacterized protein CLAFUR5_11306 [Fulvia fulva]KAK4618986.1 hypothetical protein CLAFUR0_12292 [Fulvia fulva]UJO21063.1 hypothetical protein CLAFUR5_11306 [Fulvia fulva]WPV18598.1 hypothetical protein CLAFUW4_12276 [Fulvia fulva]WPV33517.1 hypothetical protein CLAFUW7_12283 [Fulvia fulva]